MSINTGLYGDQKGRYIFYKDSYLCVGHTMGIHLPELRRFPGGPLRESPKAYLLIPEELF